MRHSPLKNTILTIASAFLCGLTVTPSVGFAANSACIAGVPCADYTAGDNQTAAMSSSRACDADFMNQITAKATLEAQREMMVNQTHIARPDSVLAYSCFDEKARVLATTVNSGKDNKYVKQLALTPIKIFLDKNFSHSYGGGKLAFNSQHTDSLGGSVNNCDAMQLVWDTAKCANIGDEAFLSFEDMTSNDPRTLPNASACSGSKHLTAEMIAVANNAAPAFKYAQMDAVDAHLDLIKAPSDIKVAKGQKKPKCGAPIPTGVKYCSGDCEDKAPKWIDEYVCSNPSCHYNGKKCRE